MTDTMRIHDPPSQPPGGEERRASEADAVDKNARPAGRRFQSFTPPDLAALGQRPGVAQSTPPSPVVVGSPLRTKVRRRDLLVALALAVAAAVVVAAMMRVHVVERDQPSVMSSAATPPSTPAAVSAVALPASPPAETVASATGSAVAEVTPPVPSVTTRVLAPATASAEPPSEPPPDPDRLPPGPHPLAPVEPPF